MSDRESSNPSHGARHQQPRPNPAGKFVCGWTPLGQPCRLGPTDWGRCCHDQWVVHCDTATCQADCASERECKLRQWKPSSDPAAGQDLGRCVPLKNAWHSRYSLALNLAVLTAGGLLVSMVLSNRHTFFAPGELSGGHRQILAGTLGAARCGQCHPAAHSMAPSVTQDQLCLNCHQAHLANAHRGLAHDLSREQIERVRWERSCQGAGHPSLPPTEREETRTTCAQCHREHHGDTQSLKLLTDARCQACHQQQFASFTDGHPEFNHYPRSRAKHIAFDHQSHAAKHFAQRGRTWECQSCHQLSDGPASQILRSVDFDKACGQCHAQPLDAALQDGWVVLQLPSLRAADVARGEEHLVDWPTDARYGYDGPITWPMRLLLAAEPDVARALTLLPDADLSAIQGDDLSRQTAARIVAAALRRLTKETANQGQVAWQRRLNGLLSQVQDRPANAAEQRLIDAMLTDLPPDLFKHMESRWFADAADIVQHSPARLLARPAAWQESLLDDGLEEDAGDSIEDLLRMPSKPGSVGSHARSVVDPPAGSSTSEVVDGRSITTAGQLAHGGGWYIDSRLYALRYLPRGHADPVLASWLQFARLVEASASLSDRPTPSADLSWLPTGQLIQDGPAACTECHRLPSSTSSLPSASWRSLAVDSRRGFTRFNHQPHLTQSATLDCQHCHRLDAGQRLSPVAGQPLPGSQSTHQSYPPLPDHHSGGEFLPIHRDQCTACHRSGGASQGCTQCHHYHVDAASLTLPGE